MTKHHICLAAYHAVRQTWFQIQDCSHSQNHARIVLHMHTHSIVTSVLQRIMLMDEISTGLDSATTYSVVDFLCRTTHVMGITTMIGLLQPPPEVYSLFDDVLVLTDG